MKNLAEKYHAGITRKGDEQLPYIVHPRAVAETLLQWGEEAASAAIPMAWGHDLLEDTSVTEAEILAVSNARVLEGIKRLTCPENMPKARYLQQIASGRDREVLLVKIADRICNSRDHIKLNGPLYAYQYLHAADCLIPALEAFSDDSVVMNALQARQELDDSLKNDARREAVRGCLLGGGVGDALGAPVEFMSKEAIRKKYGPSGVTSYVEFPDGTGSITDDTQMTLFTAEGLLRATVRMKERGICSPKSVVHIACLRWLKTQGIDSEYDPEWIDSGWLIKEKQLFKVRAPGMTCIHSLKSRRVDEPLHNNSKGCGTVMRMAPVGLILPPEAAFEYGCQFSAITHGHPTGITAGGAFAMLTAFLLEGKSLPLALELTEKHLQKLPEAAETLAALQKAESAADISELGEGWVAEEALAIAVFCALRHTWDFKAGVLEAVNITGDSDSTGAIAGNLLGLLNGTGGIPRAWLENLQEYAIVSRMADDLHRQFEVDAEGHITPEWWEKYPGF